MAKKIEPHERPLKAAQQNENDLSVLHPERAVVIQGNEITVREYGFLEGLRLLPKIQPLLNDLSALLKTDSVPLLRIQAVLAVHADLTVELIAQAADVGSEFVAELDQTEGMKIMTAWWAANSAFFLKRAVDAIITERLAENHRVGATSTRLSSSTGTTPPASDAIHKGK